MGGILLQSKIFPYSLRGVYRVELTSLWPKVKIVVVNLRVAVLLDITSTLLHVLLFIFFFNPLSNSSFIFHYVAGESHSVRFVRSV